MTQPLIAVGGMTWREFDQHCRYIVRRMAQAVQSEAAMARVRRSAGARSKASYAGVAGADVVTEAGKKSQARFLRLAAERLPSGVGWICEEDGVRKPSTLERPVVLTVDPDDGTRKFIEVIEANRLLRPGEVGSMLGVLVDGEPVASYICDAGNLTTYVRPPYGNRILRLAGKEQTETDVRLIAGPDSLSEGVLLHHGRRDNITPLAQRLTGLFGDVQRDSASIGLTVARVLGGDFAAVLRVAGGYTTPWDDAPVSAMCRQGDVVSLRVGERELRRVDVGPLTTLTARDFDMLYVRRQLLGQLRHRVRVVD